jgi:hypothetical protein
MVQIRVTFYRTIVKKTGHGFHNARATQLPWPAIITTTDTTIVKKPRHTPSTFHNGLKSSRWVIWERIIITVTDREIWPTIRNGTVEAACLHCEKRPRTTNERLCDECSSMVRIRHVYKHFRRLTPQWDEHLQRLVKRAQQKLPLFPPRPPGKRNNDAEEYPRPRLPPKRRAGKAPVHDEGIGPVGRREAARDFPPAVTAVRPHPHLAVAEDIRGESAWPRKKSKGKRKK